jgi:predicted alpha/beta-fold hydrolase
MGPLGLPAYCPRFPWLSADLQTLRDTLRPQALPLPRVQQRCLIPVAGGALLAWCALPERTPQAMVLLVHGLGGNSESVGVRRLAALLLQRGLAVLRLNLRGAGEGRALAPGSYAAQCNSDLLPVLVQARQLAQGLPLLGVGFSLGGTVLLNAVLANPGGLDGVVALSAPLDLAASCRHMQRRRNRLYLWVVVQRLHRQIAADPAGLTASECRGLAAAPGWSLEGFDAAITAPRWGYDAVEHYYAAASPLPQLLKAATADVTADVTADAPGALPPCLVLQSADDPWVPAGPAAALAEASSGCPSMVVVLTHQGGHNGFHGTSDRDAGAAASWSDRLTAAWIAQQLGG